MKEKTLFKIAMICAIVGVFVLFLLSEIYELEEKQIHEVKYFIPSEQEVKVSGGVESIRELEQGAIIEISKKEAITVVVFQDVDNLNQGDFITIVGKVEDYKGKKEIIAEKVTK